MKEANKKILRNSKFLKETIEELCSYRLNEKAHSFPTYGPISIGASVERSLDNFKSSRGKNAAITLLSVILAANRNYNKVVEPNIKIIKNEYPKLESLEDIQELVKRMSKREFFHSGGTKIRKSIQLSN